MNTRRLLFAVAILSVSHGMMPAQPRYSSWQQISYSGPGLNQIGRLATRHAREIHSSPWSVGCETLDRDYAKFSIYKDYVGALGVKHARLQSGWAKCEKEKGVYDFAWLDSCVYGLAEQEVEPWICLCYGNPLYGAGKRLGARIFTDERTMAAWLEYVEATVARYKDVVKEWEVWNEPNLRSGGHREYANLLIRTAETIKEVQPDAKVIGFALSRIPLSFAEKVLGILKDRGRLHLVDYLSYHPYAHNPDDSYEAVEELRALVHSYDPDIRLYQGENGCPAILEFGHALSYYPWTEISQAKWRMRRMAGDRLRNIRSSVFTIIDLRYPNMLQSFGLLRANLLHEVIYKRPSYYAVQHMAGIFDGTVEAVGELAYRSNSYREMTVAGFEKEGSPVVLIWYKDRIPDDELEFDLVDLTIRDIHFSDPVYVEMISGKVYDFNKTDLETGDAGTELRDLPLWDSVIMIAERSVVEVK